MNQTPRVSWPLRHRGRLACTRSLERRTAGCVLFVTCYLFTPRCGRARKGGKSSGSRARWAARRRRSAAIGRPFVSTCSTPAEVWPKLTRQSVPSPPSDYARRLDRAVDVALTCCACVSAPKGANRGADKSALDATRSRAGVRCVGPCRAALAHPRARATVGCAQRLRLQRLRPPLLL